jgi:hypothetical protein
MVSRVPGPCNRRAQTVLRSVLAKAKFWERVRGVTINDRQKLVLNKLLDGFESKLTTTKYAKLTKSSQDTALRDIADMVEKGVLVRSSEGGRSTSYSLNLRYHPSVFSIQRFLLPGPMLRNLDFRDIGTVNRTRAQALDGC